MGIKHYIISQKNSLYTENEKIFFNGKEIDFSEDLENSIDRVKVEKYQKFFSRHFDNTIVLTGAGSSYGIGKNEVKGMTMKELWDSILESCGEQAIKELGDEINFKISDIQTVDLEEFLSHANLYLMLFEGTKNIQEIVDKIKEIIIKNCTIIMPEDAPHKEFLKRITARKLKYNRLKVFTTNYDMLFEQAANECGFTMIDGFTFTFPRIFNGNNYDYDIVVRKNSRITAQENYASKVFHLYKLHGSLDWKKDENTGQIEKCDFKNNKKPVMIFPSSIKYETSYEQPFFEMMSRFQAELRMENALLIIIGYSFGDKHINSMITEALELNQSLQLVIVDPFIENFEEMIERANRTSNVMLLRSNFSDLAKNYPFSYAYSEDNIGEDYNATI